MWTFRGAWLVLAIALVHTTRGFDFMYDPVEKELEDIGAYIDDLETLNAEEPERSDGEENFRNPEGKALESVCQAVVHPLPVSHDNDFGDVIRKSLLFWNMCLAMWNSELSYANWDYETDLSSRNEKRLDDVNVQYAAWGHALSRAARQYMNDARYDSLDPDSQRQLRLLAFSTTANNPDETKRLIEVSTKLVNTYSTSKVAGMSLEPDLTKQMAESRDPDLLLAAWWGWRNATGPGMKDDYAVMVDLLNSGARDNGYKSYAEAWMESQFDETDDVESLSETLWKELEPLYQELHAYVRHKLMMKYASNSIKHRGKMYTVSEDDEDDSYFQNQLVSVFKSGGIPAHLTGNMFAQDWSNVYDIVKPFDVPETDYNKALLENGYDVEKLFDTAEAFYTSIGLYEMTPKFKTYSMKERPTDGREVVCHASACDFYTDDDFRIKMCTEVNMDYFETIHHEMGHIEYFMAYSGQPAVYRDGANSAFHEAIGDTISLSVMTSQHLQTIGLVSQEEIERMTTSKTSGNGMTEQEMHTINYLMRKALLKVAFLPFGLLIDKWRWDVFRGKVTKEDYNKHWWKLRLEYQGILAPVPRSEDDFDPGAKYHIPSNSPYICYFISFITQFQFYEAMCEASGHQGELYNCDFYESKEAGAKLLNMLRLGKSVPWKDAMEVLTGTREISTKSIWKYFQPLYVWLKKENRKNRAHPGWKDAKINWEN